MQHLEEGLIHAWLDGALPADEAARVQAHAASCAACSAMVAEARGLVAASSRIVSSLDVTPGGVIPAFGAKPARRWNVTPWRTAIAATLVIGVGLFSMQRRTPLKDSASVAVAPPATFTAPTAQSAPEAPASQPAQPIAAARKAVAPTSPALARTDGLTGNAEATARRAATETRASSARDAAFAQARADPANPPAAALAASRSVALRAIVAADPARKLASNSDSVRPQIDRVAATGAATAPAVASVAGGSARAQAPAAVMRLEQVVVAAATRMFVGCYELNESTDVLPARFALLTDASPALPGQSGVRYVDSEGRPADRILDAGWVEQNGMALISTVGRGLVLSLSRTDSLARGQSVSGPRNGRVTPCR